MADIRFQIPTILAHPSMQTDVIDLKLPYTPTYDLPSNFQLSDEIVLDVAFLSFNLQQFQLCESLDIIEEKILDLEPNWEKRWAGMLGRWKQREETLWEDVEVKTAVNTPKAKGELGMRVSGDKLIK